MTIQLISSDPPISEKPLLIKVAGMILATSKVSDEESIIERERLEETFKELVERYGSLITRLCYNYMTARTTLEDLYQDCLVNIWRGLKGYRDDSKLSTWIYRVVINTCITSYRSSRRQPELVDINSGKEAISEAGDESNENMIKLRELISQLPLLDRGIIMMWLDERSYEEIAEVTGISRANVGTRIHRIKEKMRNSLK